eukprot:3029804-Pyramimonas_sp.AAC.1
MPEGMDQEPELVMPSWCSQSITAGGGRKPDEQEEKGEVAARDKKKHKGGKDDIMLPMVKLVLTNTKDIADLGALLYTKYELPVAVGVVAVSQQAGK